MKRFIEFDMLRGILLLMMSVDHSPSSLRRFTDQPLGFFSTAECFVFVSAFLAGMLFRKRAEKLGFAAARSSSIHRAGRIYRAHLVTLFFAFVLGSFFLSELPGIRNMLDTLSDGSMGGDWWITGAAFPATLDGHPPDVRPILLSHTCCFRGSSTMGMEDGPFCQLFGVGHRTDTCQGHVGNASKDLPFVQLGPFDLLAWQFLWVGGLFIGQRFLENKALLPTPHLLRPLLVLSAIAFLFWRWISITSGPDPITQTWLFDKWHLGPLRLINFAVAASVTATFLKYLNRWEAPLRPFLLIGRHMLPVFCSQICLSVLLIGRTESGLTIEPITSALVICQLLTAPLFAWFLELRSVAKQSARPIPPAMSATHQISLAETRMKGHPLPARTVRQPVLHPLRTLFNKCIGNEKMILVSLRRW